MTRDIPIIDIGPWHSGGVARRRDIAAQVDEANRAIGFLKITGHGIPASLVEHFERTTTAFFDLPLATKLQYRSPDPKLNRGYSPTGSEALAYSLGRETPTDLFEAFNAGTEVSTPDDPYFSSEAHRLFAENRWPDEPIGMRDIWDEYMAHVRALAQYLLQVFATALRLDVDFFAARADRSPDVLRAINYERAPGQSAPLPGQMRLGAHTDFGTCTILLADEVAGLQILDSSGVWIDVIPTRGTFVVNVGDLLAAWTNDVWRSTLHRVVPPPRTRHGYDRRRSYAYFHEANHDVTVEPLEHLIDPETTARYQPFTVADHLTGKLASSRGLEPLRAVSTARDREQHF